MEKKMTYKELAQELGVSVAYLSELAELGIINKRSTVMLGSYDGEELKRIRKCCLFSMLGIAPREYVKILSGEAGFKERIKEQVDAILSDEENRSQAAIVLQNMKRECASEEELDPEPYLQHIKELKYQGGLFYDINSMQLALPGRPSGDSGTARPKNFREKLTGMFTYQEVPREDKSSEDNNTQNYYRSPDDEKGNSTQDADEKSYKPSDPDNPSDTDKPSDTENPGYDENWSPYLDKGLGASNMGSGNWHGWSPGYGTYAKPIGVRERVNNGEKTCPHPFRRFAARIVDTTIVTLICGTLLRLVFRINVNLSLEVVTYCEIIFWLFEMMIEPLLLTTIGTTPGKYIMGLKVRDTKTKGKLELKQAYIRSLKLAWQGFGFMIPIYSQFKRLTSFMRCKMNDTMPWDNGIDIELEDEHPARIVVIIAAIILLNLGDEIMSKQALIPANRGEITKEQFDQNIVELIKYTGYNGDIPSYRLEYGSNGYIKKVILEYTSEQTEINRYDEMYLCFLAFAGASEDSNGLKLLLSPGFSSLKMYYTNFETSYAGVAIVNTSDSQVRNADTYGSLFAALYGTEVTIPAFNQTFTMIKQ